MIYACVILVAGSCPILEGCEDERERVRKTKSKAEKRDMLRASRRTREEKQTETRKTETKSDEAVGARYCLETPCAGTLLL